MIFFKASLLTLLTLTLTVLLGACRMTPSSLHPSTQSPTPTSDPFQYLCLKGVQRAIDLEIAKYKGWLENGDPAQRDMYSQALNFLQEERERYRDMQPNAFRLDDAWRFIPGVKVGVYGHAPSSPPEPLVLDDASIEEPLPAPALIFTPDMTRSGPFYRIVAIPEGVELTPGKHYRLKIQPVMPATYPFYSAYVCVLEAEEISSL